MQIELDYLMVDVGYPDPGHMEWFLVKKEPRCSKFWQKILGDKVRHLISYGETKPSYETVDKDIQRYKKLIWV